MRNRPRPVFLACLSLTTLALIHVALGAFARQAPSDPSWIAATDTSRVTRKGEWTATAFRGASQDHLTTREDGAELDLAFTGRGLVVTFDGQGVSPASLGLENLGSIAVSVDGGAATLVRALEQDRDVVVARNLPHGTHRVRITHRGRGAMVGTRIAGFRILAGGEGELSVVVHGEENRFLTDVRAVVSRAGQPVRDTLVRNWLTGQCRLAGLPAGGGYTLELRASGWQPYSVENLEITDGKETTLPPVFLQRSPEATVGFVEFPRLNQPAILLPGQSFRSRFGMGGERLESVRIRRRVGPGLVSRAVLFTEDKSLAYMGYVEGAVTVPRDTPPGLYDLVYTQPYRGVAEEYISSRSVHVVSEFPSDPVFVTFGHLDTWGQEQAEYMTRIAAITNIIGPDMVLVSNEVNAAYVTGALSHLAMPYVVNFGNHRIHGYEKWYGDSTTIVDFGPDLSVLNFYGPWQGDLSHAHALLAARAGRPLKIINAYEHNAPVADMLDRYGIAMLHEAHGPAPKNERLGRTPTQRVGKIDNESFRVVRFKNNRAVSFTYRGDPQAAVPFKRHEPVPLRLSFSPANDGTARTVTATLENDWAETFADGRVVFLMPAGEYTADTGRIQSTVRTDDERYVEVTVRLDVAANSTLNVTLRPR